MRRQMAVALLNLASRILPAERRDWARDMRSELEFVKSDGGALTWAFGCVLASLHQRAFAMLKLNRGISRPVLVLEWLMCFVPLTLLWAVAVMLIVTESNAPLDLFIVAALGILGPIALIISLMATASKRTVHARRIARLLVSGFAALALLHLWNIGAHGALSLQWLRFEFGTFVLVSVLPLLGALHFDRLALIARNQEV